MLTRDNKDQICVSQSHGSVQICVHQTYDNDQVYANQRHDSSQDAMAVSAYH